MISIDRIKEDYPLHWLVWNNDYQELQELLQSERHDAEKLDPRGRTPLMLAVRLCHLQSVKALLAAKCNANAEHNGWSVVQEAVCSGDPSILTAILEVRDLQRHIQRVTHVPQLLKKLVEAPDFYIEMKWEFTSWVPLMSRLCPSDVYKVYKRGSNVRIDTTLLGFDHTTWQRGDRSYIFKGQKDSATMIEVDHEAQEVSVEQLRGVIGDINGIPPSRESVTARLNAPVSTNHIDMDKISFERNKTGIWGWRSDKIEDVNGYECKVYAASNVEFITKTRSEHLNESQARLKNSRTPLQSFLGLAEEECTGAADLPMIRDETPTSSETDSLKPNDDAADKEPQPQPQIAVTAEEYFSNIDLNGRDVGRLPKTANKVQRFKANLWLSEQFPIKLQEQVLPILDLMSTMASPHVSKLKDFITMQLPAGFPVKIEIPLFHVLNACVTFGNVFALETPVAHVSQLKEQPIVDGGAEATSAACGGSNNDERLTCIIDDCCFDIPMNYTNKGADHRRQLTFEDEDDLLQFAIQQSLMETGSESDQVDIWEALRANRPITPNNFTDEETQLQRVLQESLYGYHNHYATSESNHNAVTTAGTVTAINALPDGIPQQIPLIDPDLAMALRISEQEQLERQQELQREQEMLEEVLRLSLEEK